jgi:hypothetical protein
MESKRLIVGSICLVGGGIRLYVADRDNRVLKGRGVTAFRHSPFVGTQVSCRSPASTNVGRE